MTEKNEIDKAMAPNENCMRAWMEEYTTQHTINVLKFVLYIQAVNAVCSMSESDLKELMGQMGL